MHKRFTENHEKLMADLIKSPRLAITYLNEAAKEKDIRVLKRALKDVVETRLKALKRVKRSILEHEDLPRILSSRGNPTIWGIAAILNGLGIKMKFRIPKETKES